MAQPLQTPLAVALRFARPGVAEAVAITGQIADALAAAPRHEGRIIVPSVGDVRLQGDGEVTWAYGRETRPEEAPRAVARLLSRLLCAAEQTGGRVPAALKYAVGRALDERAPAPLASLDELRAVLGRFAPEDRRRVIAGLALRTDASPRAPLSARSTIADVRRARRDRGVTLGSISGSTGIPLSLLRELEWGLLDNWLGGMQTEEAVRAYADAAGLDPDAVLAIVLAHSNRESGVSTAPAPSRPLALTAGDEPRWRTHLARRDISSIVLVGVFAATVAWLLWAARGPVSATPSHAAAAHAPGAVAQPSHAVAHPPPPAAAPKRAPRTVRPAARPPAPVTARRHPRRLARAPGTRAAQSTIWNRPLLILKIGKPQPETGHPNQIP